MGARVRWFDSASYVFRMLAKEVVVCQGLLSAKSKRGRQGGMAKNLSIMIERCLETHACMSREEGDRNRDECRNMCQHATKCGDAFLAVHFPPSSFLFTYVATLLVGRSSHHSTRL